MTCMPRFPRSAVLAVGVSCWADPSAMANHRRRSPSRSPQRNQVDPAAAVEQVLAAIGNDDAAALAKLAAADEPDPWRVADELCFRGAFDAAAAFAEAAPRFDTKRLPDYVAERRDQPPATELRQALAASRDAETSDAALAILEQLDPDEPSVTAVTILLARGQRLLEAKRHQDSQRASMAAAKMAKKLGWQHARFRGMNQAAEAHLRDQSPMNAALLWEKTVALQQKRGIRTELEARMLGNLGILNGRMGARKKALNRFRLALEIQAEVGDLAGSSRTHRSLGNMHMQSNELPKALEHFQSALEFAQQSGDQASLASAWGSLGLLHNRRADFEQALASHEKAAELFQQIDDQAGLAACRVNAGLVHDQMGHYKQALASFEDGLRVAKAIDHRQWQANALLNLGTAHWRLGHYDKAHDLLQQVESFQDSQNPKARASLATNLALVEQSRGNFAKALTYFETALKFAERLRDREGMMTVHLDIGEMYRQIGAYQKALHQQRRARALAESLDNPARLASALEALASTHGKLGAHDRSLACSQRALALYEQLGHGPGTARALAKIGHIHQLREAYGEARSFYQRALALHEQHGDPASLSSTLTSIGHVHHCLGDYDNALQAGERALQLAEQAGHRRARHEGRR